MKDERSVSSGFEVQIRNSEPTEFKAGHPVTIPGELESLAVVSYGALEKSPELMAVKPVGHAQQNFVSVSQKPAAYRRPGRTRTTVDTFS